MEWFNFDKIKDFFYKVTEVLTLFVAVAVLVGIIFGPETAFFGDVVKNFSNILSVLGQAVSYTHLTLPTTWLV